MPRLQPELSPQSSDNIDLPIQYLFRKPKTCRPHGHRSAGHGKAFKDRYRVAPSSQIIGCHEACRTRSHDGNLTFFLGARRQVEGRRFSAVGKKTFQEVDRNGLIHIRSPADLFTWPCAQPARDGRKRILQADQGQRFVKFPFCDESRYSPWHRPGSGRPLCRERSCPGRPADATGAWPHSSSGGDLSPEAAYGGCRSFWD